MIQHKRIGAIAALFMAVAVLLTGFACLNPDALAALQAAAKPRYAQAMDKTQVLDIRIIADEAQWANMLENATAETYIPATVIIGGVKVENVGIRPKGNSSLSLVAQDETTDRFSFKLEFDHYIAGQTWLGLDKLVINNIQGDATYMKEYLSYDLMAFIGVSSPLYAYADITVNGSAWGFYLAVEAMEDSYARRVYGNGHGQLYKPESMGARGAGMMNEMLENMREGGAAEAPAAAPGAEMAAAQDARQMPPTMNGEGRTGGPGERDGGGFDGGGFGGMAGNGVSLQYTDDQPSSYSAIFDTAVFDANANDYRRVIKALKKLSDCEDPASAVDVEATLKYFAAHTVVVNLDSYVSNMGHNYYLYEEDGKLTILPWDYNLAFGGFQSQSASAVVNFPIDTPVSGVSLADRPLLGKLLEVPEYLALYHGYLLEIVSGYFESGVFAQTVDSLYAAIAPHVQNDPTAFYGFSAFEAAVPALTELGLLRAESVAGQLGGAVPSTAEGQSADAGKLVDASAVDLSALGSQGGGPGGGPGGTGFGPGGFDGMGGGDMDAMQAAMALLREAGDGELSEQQLEKLHALGLTDERIAFMRETARRGFGGGMPGGVENGEGGGAAQMPARNAPFGGQASVLTSGYDASAWLLLGASCALLLGGTALAVRYRRRGPARAKRPR